MSLGIDALQNERPLIGPPTAAIQLFSRRVMAAKACTEGYWIICFRE
jgi:hypothetical protein